MTLATSPATAFEPPAIDREAVDSLRREALSIGTKGLPLDRVGLSVDAIASAGWNVLAGDLPLPVLTLHESVLESNIATMARYCNEHDLLLAPHGKTTMAPQLFARQIDAGCWALTAATPAQLRVYRRFGISRIVYANQIVEPSVLRWLATELTADAGFEFYCLVDSIEGVARMSTILARAGLERPVGVLIEVGHEGGRGGCRTLGSVLAVADAVLRSRHLRLAGLEAFEGTVTEAVDRGSTIDEVRRFVDSFAALAAVLAERRVLPDDAIVTAGGSAFFGIVDDALASLRSRLPSMRAVLRSGSYIAHDGGFYDTYSPFGRAAPAGSPRLRAALELWSAVLSRPEHDLVILGAGKRDLPVDLGLPVPVRTWSGHDGLRTLTAGSARTQGVSDQHLHVTIDPAIEIGVGDLCACTISHPCTAFDKWDVVFVVDDELTVVDAVRTFF